LLNKNSNKTVILCLGSSTTWGYDPATGGGRFPDNIRWPSVMAYELGETFHVIEEGLNGRTVLDHIPGKHPANGYQYLNELLDRVEFDFIIICLGTNDLFANREISVKHIADGIEKMINRVKFVKPKAKIIIISPPPINEDYEAAYLYQSEIEKSKNFYKEYKHIAAINSSYFFDTGKIVSTSRIDGIHLEKEDCIKLGKYMADFVRMSL